MHPIGYIFCFGSPSRRSRWVANRQLPCARYETCFAGNGTPGRALNVDGAGGPALSLSARVLRLDLDAQRRSIVRETVLTVRKSRCLSIPMKPRRWTDATPHLVHRTARIGLSRLSGEQDHRAFHPQPRRRICSALVQEHLFTAAYPASAEADFQRIKLYGFPSGFMKTPCLNRHSISAI